MTLLREPSEQGRLRPTLGLFTATTLIVGSMIGSGIFRLPANMMARVQDPFWLLMVWVVGGIFTICGALTFAELAGIFPKAGGQYAFLRETLGKKWAFLFGWTFFWVVQTGIIAAVAVVFAEFTQRLFGFGGSWVPAVAVSCVVFLSVVNFLGARFGGLVQNIFTVAKVGALLLLIILGFLAGKPDHSTFGQDVATAPPGGLLFSAFFAAMLSGLFALDGWPQAAYVAPEIKNPKTNVPKAMILGVSTVTVVYVLATAAYLYLVEANDFIAIGRGELRGPIAAAAAAAFSGELGARLISAAVMISTFGTVNAFILTSPRIFYAVAEDGMFPQRMRNIDANTNVPTFAIAVQGTWAGLLICLSRFSNDAYLALVNATVFCIWLFYIPTTIGYFKLRRTRPDLPRPYRTTFYPIVPFLFLLAGFLVVGNSFYENVRDLIREPWTGALFANLTSIWGTIAVLLGLPFVLYWRNKEKRGEESPTIYVPAADQPQGASSPHA
ncbi:MAG TPA: amino acid permease [Candidatus Thermoplasmatota archaeon]|nr:amino acid permease [Candidatus Thermoplasmatota archaeon]